MPKSQTDKGGLGSKAASVRRSQSGPRPRALEAQVSGRKAATPLGQFDDLLGQGAALWDDQEFESFQEWLRHIRRSGE
jgi:hypothetical protein